VAEQVEESTTTSIRPVAPNPFEIIERELEEYRAAARAIEASATLVPSSSSTHDTAIDSSETRDTAIEASATRAIASSSTTESLPDGTVVEIGM